MSTTIGHHGLLSDRGRGVGVEASINLFTTDRRHSKVTFYRSSSRGLSFMSLSFAGKLVRHGGSPRSKVAVRWM